MEQKTTRYKAILGFILLGLGIAMQFFEQTASPGKFLIGFGAGYAAVTIGGD